MDWELIIGVLLRWMHILAAVTAVGGTIFARLALVPSLGVLSEESRGKLHEAIREHWARPVQIAITFLLISGIINIITLERQFDLGRVAYYRPLFGIKFLLAFVVFFLASVLTGHGKATQRFRDNRRYWLTVNMVLAITIVLISGILRKSNPPLKPTLSAVPIAEASDGSTS
jgi:uncharacterized membrane protein